MRMVMKSLRIKIMGIILLACVMIPSWCSLFSAARPTGKQPSVTPTDVSTTGATKAEERPTKAEEGLVLARSTLGNCNFVHIKSINQDNMYKDYTSQSGSVPKHTTCGFVAAYNAHILVDLLSKKPNATHQEMHDAIRDGIGGRSPQEFIAQQAVVLDDSLPTGQKLALYAGENHPAEGLIEVSGIKKILIDAKTPLQNIVFCNGNYEFENSNKISMFSSLDFLTDTLQRQDFNYEIEHSVHLNYFLLALERGLENFFIFVCPQRLPGQNHWLTCVVRKNGEALEVIVFDGKNEMSMLPPVNERDQNPNYTLTWLYNRYIRNIIPNSKTITGILVASANLLTRVNEPIPPLEEDEEKLAIDSDHKNVADENRFIRSATQVPVATGIMIDAMEPWMLLDPDLTSWLVLDSEDGAAIKNISRKYYLFYIVSNLNKFSPPPFTCNLCGKSFDMVDNQPIVLPSSKSVLCYQCLVTNANETNLSRRGDQLPFSFGSAKERTSYAYTLLVQRYISQGARDAQEFLYANALLCKDEAILGKIKAVIAADDVDLDTVRKMQDEISRAMKMVVTIDDSFTDPTYPDYASCHMAKILSQDETFRSLLDPHEKIIYLMSLPQPMHFSSILSLLEDVDLFEPKTPEKGSPRIAEFFKRQSARFRYLLTKLSREVIRVNKANAALITAIKARLDFIVWAGVNPFSQLPYFFELGYIKKGRELSALKIFVEELKTFINKREITPDLRKEVQSNFRELFKRSLASTGVLSETGEKIFGAAKSEEKPAKSDLTALSDV